MKAVVVVPGQRDEAGLGQVRGITAAGASFTPRGCPFQAWSLGELRRLEPELLA